MKTSNTIVQGIVGGLVLLLFSFLSIKLLVAFAPHLAEQYYDPMFSMEGNKTIIFFMHPFVVSFALAWFWRRFKGQLTGPAWWRGLELGIAYALVAMLPSMWMTFSALAISFQMVATWLVYGLLQGTILGLLYAKMDP
jgi:hypothetical protein